MEKGMKEFLDTVMNTANAVGETVAEVTREGAKKWNAKKEAAKLNMEVLRARSAIEDMQTEIGRETCAIHKTTDELDSEERQIHIEELMEEIEERTNQIAQLNRQIELLNGGLICQNCSRISPADYGFCPSCGTKLEKPVKESEEQEDACCQGCCAPEGECGCEEDACGCDCCKTDQSEKEE